jgi:hypothetical protein
MLRLDDHLSRGTPPAEALMKARGDAEISSAFVCFGAG